VSWPARRFGASELVDQCRFAVGDFAATLAKYPALDICCRRWATAQGQMHELESDG